MDLNKKGMLVSIIVPVYNVESYLDECVKSIMQQTYKNIEIILVDDGSTDKSGILCDEYKKMDERIAVIHKVNGGLSDARNAGLKIANGDYISFVDSDDIISTVFIESFMVPVIEGNCDVVAMKWGTNFWNGEKLPKLALSLTECSREYMDPMNALECMLYQQIATGAPFKIYKKSLFDDIAFPVGYYYEDVATTYKAFLKANKVAVITGNLYAYRMRKNSIIRQNFSEKKLVALKIFDQLFNDQEITKNGLHKAAVSRGYAMLFSVYLQIPFEQSELRKKVWKKLKSGRQTVMFDGNKLMRKKNRHAAWVSLLGMDATYKIGRKFGQKGSMN